MHILLFILCFEILFSEWKIDIYLFIHFKYQLQFPLPPLHPLPLNPYYGLLRKDFHLESTKPGTFD